MAPAQTVHLREQDRAGQPAGLLYSYSAVAAAGGAGIWFPHSAAAVLGPVLLVGLVGLGVAHGACDQLVLPAYRPVQGAWGRYLLQFSCGYLGLAAAVGVVWWCWPAGAIGLFLGLTVWHWGSADAPASSRQGVWVVHSVLRGALLLAVPAWWWPAETARSVNGLLQLAGSGPVSSTLGVVLGPAVLAGHLALWGYFAWHRELRRWYRDAREVLLLTGLFMALPPLLALGVYFVFWHSLQHVLRLSAVLGYRAPGHAGWLRVLGGKLVFFGQRALPMLAASLAPMVLLYALRLAPPLGEAWLGLAVVAASVLTLPHALLVSLVMDASKWQLGQPKQLLPDPGAEQQGWSGRH